MEENMNKLYCNKCDIQFDKLIAKGSFGKIYDTCCNNDSGNNCNHVVKISESKDAYKLINEQSISVKMAIAGIGPKICTRPNTTKYLAEIEENVEKKSYTSIVIMEKLKYDLVTFLDYLDEKKEPNKNKINVKMQQAIFDIIDKFHNTNYAHFDLHAGNIMIDSENKFKIIDYGFMKYFKNGVPEIIKFFDTYYFLFHDKQILVNNMINNRFTKRGIFYKTYYKVCNNFATDFTKNSFYNEVINFDEKFAEEVKDYFKKNWWDNDVLKQLFKKHSCQFIMMIIGAFRISEFFNGSISLYLNKVIALWLAEINK